MRKELKKIIIKLLIISIFFNVIFNINPVKRIRAESINSSVLPNNDNELSTYNDLIDGNYSEANENNFINNENKVLDEEVENIEVSDELSDEETEKETNEYLENYLLEGDTDSKISVEHNNELNNDELNNDEYDSSKNNSSEEVGTYSLENTAIQYQAHVQDIGWQDWVSNGTIAGTTGKVKAIEALNIKLDGIKEGVVLKYRSHIKNIGWQDWKNNGELTGTTGQSLSMEAIEIVLEGNTSLYNIMYRVHIRDIGWQDWKKNGELAGTTGMSKPIEAIEIKLVENRNISDIKYQTHVSNEGWSTWSGDGNTSGSAGSNQIEAFKIELIKNNNSIIKYRSYIKNQGWQEWKSSGEISGTEGKALPIEEIEIALDNAPEGYSIEYRIRTKYSGFSDWKKDGQTISSNGDVITGIQVRVKDSYSIPTISYQSHVRNIGWQNYVSNGELAGTTGKALSIEAIKIDYRVGDLNSNILYKTHVQDIGWQDWVSNNEIAGTTGIAKAIEAIQIKQENPIKGYRLKYRVHIRDLGWQEWKSEGEVAGTTGLAKPIEAIEIKFVEDNLKTIVIDPGHNFGGDDGAYATHNGITYIERDLNMQIAMKLKMDLENNGFNVILTRNPEDRETIAMRQSLQKRVNIANSSDAELFISIHQNSSTAAAAKGVEVYYSSEKPIYGNAYSYKIDKSKVLATNISKNLSNTIATNNRGAKDEEFYVVKNTLMPSILIECGFITNREEASKLSNSTYQEKIATTISNEVVKLFN